MNRIYFLLIVLALLLSACASSQPPQATPTLTLTPTRTVRPSLTPTLTRTPTPSMTPSPTETVTPTPWMIQTRPAGYSYPTRIIYPLWGEIPGDIWLRRTAWVRDMTFTYHSGQVLLSGGEDGMKQIFMDDALRLFIVRPDGSQSEFYLDPSIDCQYHRHLVGPYDLTEYFQPGVNLVHAELIDMCPKGWGIDGLYLVEFR
jgi:hypothetical protein